MTNKKRVIICDDEARARQVLINRFLEFPEFEIIAEASNGTEALELIQTLSPDLIMLDINMPFISGLHIFQKIGLEKMPPTIFVTAYSEFAVEAFDLYAVDYLLKPFTKERFNKALQKVEDRINQKDKSNKNDIKQFLDYLSKTKLSELSSDKKDTTSKYLQRVTIDSITPWEVIEVKDIEWISAEDHYVKIYTQNSNYLLSEKISQIELKLNPSQFCRIHRSQIVNLEKVTHSITGKFNTLILKLQSGKTLKVSRSRRSICQIALMKWSKSN